MTATFTAATICEEALREIGALAPIDQGPDPAEYKVAVRRFDILMAELAGMDRFWWLTPKTQSLVIPANSVTVPLNDLAIPLQQVVGAKRVDAQGQETPLDLMGRLEWEAIDNRTLTGQLSALYIERDQDPDIYTYRIPTENTTVRLFGYGFAPDFYANLGQVAHQFAESFQMYLILVLAENIGRGAVRSLPLQDLRELERRHKDKWSLLAPFATRQNLSRPRFTKPQAF